MDRIVTALRIAFGVVQDSLAAALVTQIAIALRIPPR